ncbi:MAG: hypothetical protein GWP05_04485 [Anaerolineaceae bacterium]|nr:hypothetical protein [Anaerolineaceae bacterium]
MEKLEVVQRTLNFQEAPYVPVCAGAVTKEFLLEVTGAKSFTKFNARAVFVEAMRKLDCDIVLQYVLPFPERYDRTPEASVMPRDHTFTPSVIRREGTGFNSPEEVRDFIHSLPHPKRLGEEFPFEENYLAWIELMENGKRSMGDMVWIPGHVAGIPDFMLYTYFGYENYLMALSLYPEEMKSLFKLSAEEAQLRNSAIARAVLDKGYLNWVYLGEDICFNDGPLCSPETLREMYWPAAKYALEPLHEAGIKVLWHCDGNINPILEDLVDIGVAGLQGFEEETGVDMEKLSEVRTRDGDRMVLFGSVSVTTLLPNGTVAEVEKRIERIVELSRNRGGGIVLSSSSSILPGTPNENIYPLFRYSKEYGGKVPC